MGTQLIYKQIKSVNFLLAQEAVIFLLLYFCIY